MPLAPLPDTYDTTRIAARRIAAHIMSRPRKAAVGHIDLAPMSGGFGTPSFGDDQCVIRLSGGVLVVERTPVITGSNASTIITEVNGSTLAQLAAVAGADLASELDVGHDTPALGDVDEPISFDGASMTQIGTWLAMASQVLDRVLAALPADAAPSRARLWPEHFDLGIDIGVGSGADVSGGVSRGRLNLGASPGDDFQSSPYLYVAPWDDARPGDAGYWNAPFGAVLGYDDVAHAPSAFAAGIDFITEGIARFT